MESFYGRKKEMDALGQIERQSRQNACFTLVTGRRRIGKTQLLRHFISDKKGAYLFTVRTTEKNLCEMWQKSLEQNLGLKIFGKVESLAELFEQVMLYSRDSHFILVMDEFQDLEFVNKSFFSQMQNLWDSLKSGSKINLIVCGSVYSLMTKIFKDDKEPLFGRATHSIHLKPFEPSVVKTILSDYNPRFKKEDLLCLYMLSGGVAKYVFLLMYAGAGTKAKMLDAVCNMASPFLTDGRDLLISEIGRDYGVYFSILQAIAGGHTIQSEIDSIIQKNTGAYLHNLNKVFDVVEQIRPLLSKSESRNARWKISDEYMNFYFRFIYPHQDLIELGNYDMLKEYIIRDYETYTGRTLECYFTAKIQEEEEFSKIGGWWDRKSMNELDIITLNEIEKKCCIYEVKRQAKKISLDALKEKSRAFLQNLNGYDCELLALSMDDM